MHNQVEVAEFLKGFNVQELFLKARPKSNLFINGFILYCMLMMQIGTYTNGFLMRLRGTCEALCHSEILDVI